MGQVFISHSSKDKILADELLYQLEKGGLSCWIAPRDIEAGSNYAQSILDALAKARFLVLIYTKHSESSDQVHKEVDRAVNNKLTLKGKLLKSKDGHNGLLGSLLVNDLRSNEINETR